MSTGTRPLADVEADVQRAFDEGDFTRAAALELEFRDTLARHVAALREADDTAALAATLEAAAIRVARLIGEVSHHERRLVREATMISTGRRAAAAYASAHDDAKP